MNLSQIKIYPSFLFPMAGYLLLLYITILLPSHLYEPTGEFHLPGLLWFIHLILLYIHEAGHLLLSIFGETMTILGGSLMQILAPLIWYVVARYEESKLSNVALVFTGISMVDVSIYIKDAGMLQLPLIGGLGKSHHDWANVMNEWGMIEWSYSIGECVFWAGMGLCVFGIAHGLYESWKESRISETD